MSLPSDGDSNLVAKAFRPGNVDLPANQTHAVNPATLTLPDVLTELDLLAPMPDPDLLLSQPSALDLRQRETTLLDWADSQLLSESVEQRRAEPETLQLEEVEDLELDIGEGPSIEQARDAHAARRPSEEFEASPRPLEDYGLALDFSEEMDTTLIPSKEVRDITMGGIEIGAAEAPEEEFPGLAPAEEIRERATLSPLSSIRSSIARDVERTFQETTGLFQPEEEIEEELARQAHKAKKRKILQADADTEIHSSQIRAQQNDRSRILKPASFLPRDPMLLALMTMQKNGGFVSSILGEGRSQGWAPELRGILSLEVVRRSGELKRKRDEEIAEAQQAAEELMAEGRPGLEFEQEELDLGGGPLDVGGDTTLGAREIYELPEEEGLVPPPEEGLEQRELAESEEPLSPPPDHFDETTAPLLHPAETGPVSLGTKHAVHLLRERFGPAAAEDPSERQRTTVLFQDLLPEASTSKADATKMFFEVLVLATKDAIKVDQPTRELGGPIRIRGKRGLWGAWAETQAGGEIASQGASVPTAISA